MGMSNRELVERYLRCYNEKNVDAMVELFAEDAAFESVSNTNGGVKTAGQEIRLRGASFFTIRDGRISRLADYM
jgi:ketosteroid isomerase-like protein